MMMQPRAAGVAGCVDVDGWAPAAPPGPRLLPVAFCSALAPEHRAVVLLPSHRWQMTFGQQPPPLDQDPVSRHPCLASCTTGIAGAGRCHKLD